eukprot:CAMPEP_0198200300 /NCGR_PEP_ID=MMETSP1445-20131203/3338_1 /TAXON_ID=36898 /ORGANISM="Pyramimonas sp., Strain CCMP2087" /LENGTH=171 /DNA_ID=CAMNT_0043870325 /DNA_START=889 /DNA_END=1404 /DNA_ORIENTATION=+
MSNTSSPISGRFSPRVGRRGLLCFCGSTFSSSPSPTEVGFLSSSLVRRFGGRLKETSLAVCSPEFSSWFCNSSFWGRAKDPSFLRLLGSFLSSLSSAFSSASMASSLSLLGDAVGSFVGAMTLSATGSGGGGDGAMPLSATGSGGAGASLSVGASLPAFLLPLHPITPTQN